MVGTVPFPFLSPNLSKKPSFYCRLGSSMTIESKRTSIPNTFNSEHRDLSPFTGPQCGEPAHNIHTESEKNPAWFIRLSSKMSSRFCMNLSKDPVYSQIGDEMFRTGFWSVELFVFLVALATSKSCDDQTGIDLLYIQ